MIGLIELTLRISLDTENSKWRISEKKGPRITQISKANISGTNLS